MRVVRAVAAMSVLAAVLSGCGSDPVAAPPAPVAVPGERAAMAAEARALLSGAASALRAAGTGRIETANEVIAGPTTVTTRQDVRFDLGLNRWTGVKTMDVTGAEEVPDGAMVFDLVGTAGRSYLRARSEAWEGKPWLAYRWVHLGGVVDAEVMSLHYLLMQARGVEVHVLPGGRTVTATIPADMAMGMLEGQKGLRTLDFDLEEIEGHAVVEIDVDEAGAPVSLSLAGDSLTDTNLPAPLVQLAALSRYTARVRALGEPVDVAVPQDVRLVTGKDLARGLVGDDSFSL